MLTYIAAQPRPIIERREKGAGRCVQRMYTRRIQPIPALFKVENPYNLRSNTGRQVIFLQDKKSESRDVLSFPGVIQWSHSSSTGAAILRSVCVCMWNTEMQRPLVKQSRFPCSCACSNSWPSHTGTLILPPTMDSVNATLYTRVTRTP